jgi:hypothetical protein
LFNYLGIAWEYEPQGFLIPFGNRYEPLVPYLPDFWLPAERIWVEVKGGLSDDDLTKLIGATWDGNGLPATPDGGLLNDDIETRREGNPAGNRNGPRLLILGPIPDMKQELPAHHVLCHHKSDVIVGHAVVSPKPQGYGFEYAYGGDAIACDSGERYPSPCMITGTCQSGIPVAANGGIRAAYSAARSARFEHGEQG